MFEISVEARFRASHRLCLGDGTCEPLHEHDWRVRVTFAGSALRDSGMLMDFAEAKLALETLVGDLEGGQLNEHPAFASSRPSAENVAIYVANNLAQGLPEGVHVAWVEIEEEGGCLARFYPAAQ